MLGAHEIPLSSIIVPEGRFRPVKDKVEDMAQSFATFGQLQPIIVVAVESDGELKYELVDGLHRYTAAQMNGQLNIYAVFPDEIDPLLKRKIELEANIQRIDMTWQEQQHAIAELHRLETELNPQASQESTAALAGVHQRDVSTALKLTKMIELFPEIAEAKSVHQALSWAESKAKRVLRAKDVRDKPQDFAGIENKLVLGDSVDVIKTIASESFDLVLTDPPFGIDLDNRKAGTESTLTAYADDTESYVRILSMAPDLYRVIKPDGWLVWFLGISWYERAKQAFREAGFLVDEIPIIWDRSEGRCYTNRPDRYFARAYDIALHCLKGDPQVIIRGKPNIIKAAPVSVHEREQLVERPVELYQEIIRRLTIPGEVVADFFTGSGSVLAAAASLQRDYFGVELDAERRAYALNKIKAYTGTDISKSKASTILAAQAATG